MTIENELTVREIYYSLYPQEEDEMQGMLHGELIRYLLAVLSWYYRFEPVTLISDLPFIVGKVQVAADVAVVKGVSIPLEGSIGVESWRVEPPYRPAPVVAIEISSKKTWMIDVGNGETDKPVRYGQIGVREYYAFDGAGHWQNSPVRLRAWEYKDGQPIERQPDEQGRFWSNELNCYVAPVGLFLRLLDAQGNRLLTKSEAEEQRAQREAHRAEHAEAEAETAKILAENERAKLAQVRKEVEAEKARAENERAKAKTQEERAKALELELENLRAKLKAKDIDLEAI
jgi:Uma2 family endonuclease